MAYGIFNNEQHLFTFSEEFHARRFINMSSHKLTYRELTSEEYIKRMREIYIEGKYK